jgi:predicted transglutaminase-like cysteine proteinase
MPTSIPHSIVSGRHATAFCAALALWVGGGQRAEALVLPFSGVQHHTSDCGAAPAQFAAARQVVSTEAPAAGAVTTITGPNSRLAQLRAAQEGRAAAAPASMTAPLASFDSPLRSRCAAGLTAMTGPLAFRVQAFSPLTADARLPAAEAANLVLPIARREQPVGLAAPVSADQPAVFGSVAILIGRTSLDSRWRSVRSASLTAAHGPWVALLREAGAKPRLQALEMTNRWVNARVAFAADGTDRNGKSLDRWSRAEQTLQRGRGDCEDYAIAKMTLLRSLGVADKDMYLVVVRDQVVRDDHMLLVVRDAGRLYALDSRSDRLLDASQPQDYRPIMSFSGNRAWFHGYATDTTGTSAR